MEGPTVLRRDILTRSPAHIHTKGIHTKGTVTTPIHTKPTIILSISIIIVGNLTMLIHTMPTDTMKGCTPEKSSSARLRQRRSDLKQKSSRLLHFEESSTPADNSATFRAVRRTSLPQHPEYSTTQIPQYQRERILQRGKKSLRSAHGTSRTETLS